MSNSKQKAWFWVNKNWPVWTIEWQLGKKYLTLQRNESVSIDFYNDLAMDEFQGLPP